MPLAGSASWPLLTNYQSVAAAAAAVRCMECVSDEADQQIVLEEDVEENYEPDQSEILEYAEWLGMDVDKEQELLWIAREALKAPLPDNWKPCRAPSNEVYYFNFATGESIWEHPCDKQFKGLYKVEKARLSKSRATGAQGNTAHSADASQTNLGNSSSTPSTPSSINSSMTHTFCSVDDDDDSYPGWQWLTSREVAEAQQADTVDASDPQLMTGILRRSKALVGELAENGGSEHAQHEPSSASRDDLTAVQAAVPATADMGFDPVCASSVGSSSEDWQMVGAEDAAPGWRS